LLVVAGAGVGFVAVATGADDVCRTTLRTEAGEVLRAAILNISRKATPSAIGYTCFMPEYYLYYYALVWGRVSSGVSRHYRNIKKRDMVKSRYETAALQISGHNQERVAHAY
jgi:hypothetical protein